jgi:hypothetical protein
LADLIGTEAVLLIEKGDEKHRNKKAIFLLLSWSERQWEIGRISGAPSQHILCDMVMRAKNGKVRGLNEDVGAFANGISAPDILR